MDDRGTPAIAYRFLDWRYEPALRRLVGPAGEARLKPLLDRLLRRLLDEPGAVLARERLIDEVWTRREVNDEVLSRAIAELRGVLGDDARAPRYVETLSKGGYRWIAPVDRIAAPSPADASPQGTRAPWRIAATAVLAVVAGLAAFAGWWHARERVAGPAALAMGLLGAHPLASDPRLEYDARFDPAGRVAYVRGTGDGDASELVLVDPKTLAERVLWQDDHALRRPAPSPDGREIALTRYLDGGCELWSVALVDLQRTHLAECAPAPQTGPEWVEGGEALVFTGSAADAAHAPGLVVLDRRRGMRRVLTTPDIAEGAHVDARLSPDRTRLVYASRHAGEEQLWQADWPAMRTRTALLDRSEPAYAHAFEPAGNALWVAGDLTLYRALHRLRAGHRPELIGGRGALSIDLAPNGAAVWAEANYDADVWLRANAQAPWRVIARSNRYESQPEFSPDGTRIALISNRSGAESVLVVDLRDGKVRPLALDPAFRWLRPTWTPRGDALVITAYEDRHTRLYRYPLDGDVATPIAHVETDAFLGVELADRLVYLGGHGNSRPLMQLRAGSTVAEPAGIEAVTTYRASNDWVVWRAQGSTDLHVARWLTPTIVRTLASDDDGEAFTITGDVVTWLDHGALWRANLPDGTPVKIASDRVPDGNGPSLAAGKDGALALVTLTSLGIDLMIAEAALPPGPR
ncbi:winged helix-turn-helix domain-containing protein [Dokdonella fugitiva]|uniref:DNA-binding winged helix-turn-helix (WHTH) protein n=1 Tax=Dokdonella fugitiva TaxID=328517 RepID=A0A4R2I7S9_9GAMM|nr:winged helix-turn-helix domain-containing protein [Dokdonella fugitiva]TCO39976.1 DNA-binding winged helix-turn-helix (wHTH) protein [Dokdonella fugitiva]